jgi:hypothetical protein
VAAVVRGVSSSEVAAIAGIVAAAVSVVAVVVTIVYGEIERRLARSQLALAKEQAELRPELVVSDMQLLGLLEAGVPEEYVQSYEVSKVQRDLECERGVEPSGPPPPDHVLRFNLSNRGRVAATHVVGRIYLRAAHLQPPAMVLQSARFGYAVSKETTDGYFVVHTQRLPDPLLTAEEPVTFDIAVCVRATARTSVRYEFVSAEGGPPAKGEASLEVAA